MADKKRVLLVTQELNPYVVLSNMSNLVRELPKYIHEQGMEIRILMPKFGTINERRHRLHEVVRLSGINIIIDEDDYPLIIKVASLPGARLQVYFLDNEDFFKRKAIFGDDKEEFFDDNSERMIFFCKGVLETVRKFGWAPDIIHCHGWMTSLIPLYLRKAYKNDPVFRNARVIYSVYDSEFKGPLSEDFLRKAPLIQKNIGNDELATYRSPSSGLDLGAASYADGVVLNAEKLDDDVEAFLKDSKKPLLRVSEDQGDYLADFHEFYEQLLTAN